MPERSARIRGALLGGAVGDALGAPIEFWSLDRIRAHYGDGGIADFDVAYGVRGAITDDTQMTLFTAEGMLRAISRMDAKGICHPPSVANFAYLRWLYTQDGESALPLLLNATADGWLVHVRELHRRRAPGNTCLSALRAGGGGTIERPINDSKGCGGVMRIAPVGLVRAGDPFTLGCELAALTHGHPSGYLAAGFLAQLISAVLDGRSLLTAAEDALTRVVLAPRSNELARALRLAIDFAEQDLASGNASADRVERLGAGWVAEEAAAIALYCAFVAGDDFERGVRLAVNHSGDSDSTGAIAGNILGALLGEAAIPRHWLDGLELRATIEQVADDLATEFRDDPEWWGRYPGW